MFKKIMNESLQKKVVALTQENTVLKTAIRKHRDQRGDDRCWMDDDELYRVLNEPLFDRPMPSPDKMLKNCEKFISLRTKPGSKTDDTSASGRWVSRAELEEQRAAFERVNDLVRKIRDLCVKPR